MQIQNCRISVVHHRKRTQIGFDLRRFRLVLISCHYGMVRRFNASSIFDALWTSDFEMYVHEKHRRKVSVGLMSIEISPPEPLPRQGSFRLFRGGGFFPLRRHHFDQQGPWELRLVENRIEHYKDTTKRSSNRSVQESKSHNRELP